MRVIVMKIIGFVLIFLITGIADASIRLGSMTPAGVVPKEAQIVTIGFFPVSMYGLDMISNTVHLDTYLWMKWKGDIDPTESMELVNAVDKSSLVKAFLLKEPSILTDGTKYQVMRVEGSFFQKFTLSDFPFDKQKLSILIEDSTHGFEQVSYVIDQASSGIGDQFDVPGWNIKNWTSSVLIHDYGTSFGEKENVGGGSTYSAASFDIQIDRPSSYFYWKLLLPLIIVISGAWVSLVLDPSHIDTRTGMPATALLTTVFLQQGYTDNLPQVGYLVLMDKIYVVAYILIVLTLIRGISTSYLQDVNADAINKNTIKKNDRIILLSQIVVFSSYIIWIVTFF
jgi:hypothetical protein